jgi:spermidine synthase
VRVGHEEGPAKVRAVVQTGVAELVPDPDVPEAWTLLINGVAQSHVDLNDPQMIAFDYVRRMVDIVEVLAPPGPLDVLHLGAGAMTLPRCLAAIRPGSVQRVVEIDADLLDLVHELLPLQDPSLIETVVGDAARELEAAQTESYDVIVADVFQGAKVPEQTRTPEFAQAAARALRRGGCFVANIMDGPPLTFARAQTARLREAFADVAVISDASVLRGRRLGNLLLVGGVGVGFRPLVRRLAADPFATRIELGDKLDRFVNGR